MIPIIQSVVIRVKMECWECFHLPNGDDQLRLAEKEVQ